MIGQTVSHYRIIEKLGGGGMGVVYRAKRVNLSCLVSIKVPPRECAHDNGWSGRFVPEIRLRLRMESKRR